MKKLVVKRNDGGVSIIIPSLYAIPELLERDALAVSGYISHREIDDDKLPQDRYFREAWTDDFATEIVDINMDKARAIHMDQLRQLRSKKFEQLGFAIQPNPDLEALLPQVLQDILQSLRDIPQTYDLSVATTPNELKNMIPAILN